MTTRTRNILSGATAVVGLVALCWMVFVFGEMPAWLEKLDTIYIDMPDAGGLASGSRVTLNGIDVGYVDAVRHHADPRQGVEVVCSVHPEYRIPTVARPSVLSGVFGGSAVLAIQVSADDGQGELAYLASGDRLVGSSSTLTERLEQRLDEGLKHFDDLTTRIGALADEYVAVGRKVNDLLAERSVADVEAGRSAPNLRTVIARADADLADLRTTIAHINGIVGDKQLRSDITAAAGNARKLTEDARASLDTLTKRYVAAADELTGTLKQVNELVAAARSGKGTMGKLVNDPALYNSLEDAANRLGESLKELQLLIRKWKAEGLPVQF